MTGQVNATIFSVDLLERTFTISDNEIDKLTTACFSFRASTIPLSFFISLPPLSPSLSFLLSLPFFLTLSRSSSLFLCSYFSLSPSFLTPFISYSLSPSLPHSFFFLSFLSLSSSLSFLSSLSLSTLFSLSFMAFCLFRIFKIH